MNETEIKEAAIKMYNEQGSIDAVALANILKIKVYAIDKGDSYIEESILL